MCENIYSRSLNRIITSYCAPTALAKIPIVLALLLSLTRFHDLIRYHTTMPHPSSMLTPLSELGGLFQGVPHKFTLGAPPDAPPFALLNIADVSGLTVVRPSGAAVRLALPYSVQAQQVLRPGDVLIATRTRPLRASAVTELGEAGPPLVVSQNLAILRPRPDSHHLLYPPYLAVYLNSPDGQASVQSNYDLSSTTPVINLRTLGQLPVPLPDLPTQRHIAALALAFEQEEQAQLAALHERRMLVQQAIRQATRTPSIS